MSNSIIDVAISAEEMLSLGVFAGTLYFPNKTANDNFYGVTASLKTWPAAWIGTDKMGWFDWWQQYCKGRRLPEEDAKQIARWQNFGRRHLNGFFQACLRENKTLANKEFWARSKQALLHWGIDVRKPNVYHAFLPDKLVNLPSWWENFIHNPK